MRIENSTSGIPTSSPAVDRAQKTVPPAISPSPANLESVDSVVSLHKAGGSALHFAVEADSTTKEIVVKLIDQTTGEVIQQMPPEAILQMARAIDEMIAARQRSVRSQG